MSTNTYIERVMIVLNDDGTLKGAHAESLVDGVRQDAVALTADALAAVLPDRAALVATIDTLQSQIAQVQVERDEAVAQRDALQAQIDAAAAKAKLVVSPLQARKALKAANLLATVQAMISAAPEDDDIRLAWDWALSWERDSPFVAQLGAGLGLSDKQIDDLFAAAAAL